MTNNSLGNIEKLEADLWEAADNLRAHSKLASSDYFMPKVPADLMRLFSPSFAVWSFF